MSAPESLLGVGVRDGSGVWSWGRGGGEPKDILVTVRSGKSQVVTTVGQLPSGPPSQHRKQRWGVFLNFVLNKEQGSRTPLSKREFQGYDPRLCPPPSS